MNDAIATTSETNSTWLTRDVLFICLSACFADLGYQAVLAIFPLFLAHQPPANRATAVTGVAANPASDKSGINKLPVMAIFL